MFQPTCKPNRKITQACVFLLSMLRTKYNFFFLLVAVFLMQSFHPGVQEIKHPFYVSVSEIRIDDQKKQLTLSCKLFTDDLQDAIYKQFKWKADLKNESPEKAEQADENVIALEEAGVGNKSEKSPKSVTS